MHRGEKLVMKMKLNDEIESYLKEVKLLMPIHFRAERKYLRDFRTSVEKFIGEDSSITRLAVEQYFGRPQQVITEYLYTLDQYELCRRTSLRKSIKRFTALVIVLILLSVVFSYGTAFMSYWKGAHQPIKYTERTIE